MKANLRHGAARRKAAALPVVLAREGRGLVRNAATVDAHLARRTVQGGVDACAGSDAATLDAPAAALAARRARPGAWSRIPAADVGRVREIARIARRTGIRAAVRHADPVNTRLPGDYALGRIGTELALGRAQSVDAGLRRGAFGVGVARRRRGRVDSARPVGTPGPIGRKRRVRNLCSVRCVYRLRGRRIARG
jgi:hypothetical protein